MTTRFPGRGAAYVFVRSGTSWTRQAKLTADDGEYEDSFGNSVSISGDYAIVGSWCDDDQGTQSGSAYVFVRSGTGWTQQAKLLPGDGADYDYVRQLRFDQRRLRHRGVTLR